MKDLALQEMKEISGGTGVIEWIGLTLLGGLLCDVLLHYDDTSESFSNGQEQANDFWGK